MTNTPPPSEPVAVRAIPELPQHALAVRISAQLWVILLVLLCAACARNSARGAGDLSTRPTPSLAPAADGVQLAWSSERCTAALPDADRDKLSDDCERALANAFAPLLQADPRECGWDRPLGRIGGEYLFAVQPLAAGGAVRIAYLPAYYVNCGWSGFACVVALGRCGYHAGDSEAILLDIGWNAEGDRWHVQRIFLSAHCFARAGGRCRWYEGSDLDEFEWVGESRYRAPRIWVASGKHANYPTRRACERSHWALERCVDAAAYRFPIVHNRQNVGSRAHPFMGNVRSGCIDAAYIGWRSALPHPGVTECFWDPARRFGGWQAAAAEGSTAYAVYLLRVAGF